MTWFKCFVRGENFPGELVGEDSLVGFYTTRYVESESASELEKAALDDLRSDPRLKLSKPPLSEPKVFFEEFEEIQKSLIPAEEEGFVWYLMEDA